MVKLASIRRKPGSVTHQKQFSFTLTCKQVKASIVSVLMWLAVIGGAL